MNSLDANYELLRAARELIQAMDRRFTVGQDAADYNSAILSAIQRLRQAVGKFE